ncbi:MAG: nucleotidyltransferase domain-containing protein [Clostridiales bacterium]|jgi:predicted nucleotidyltransferase|nr:nucleotidyltransferase domain-containing protein [Clostridiales bacterium]
MNIGLTDKHASLIVETLSACGVSRAVVFGSRAKGDWRGNSDIDIAVSGCVNIGGLLIRLDELPMPYKFDVVDYETISHQPLREHIDRVGVELFSREISNNCL